MSENLNENIEKKMTLGCTVYTLLSIVGFVLAVIPFFFVRHQETMSGLLTAIAFGWLPVQLAALFFVSRYGLPAASGIIASSLAFAVFLGIRVTEFLLAAKAERIPDPDYPASIGWILPLLVVLFCIASTVFITLISAPKQKSQD